MATITLQHSSFGSCSIEFDIDDVTYRVSAIRCINLVNKLGDLL